MGAEDNGGNLVDKTMKAGMGSLSQGDDQRSKRMRANASSALVVGAASGIASASLTAAAFTLAKSAHCHPFGRLSSFGPALCSAR
jgi:hypothetical protein